MYFGHIYSQLIPDPLLPPFPPNFRSSLSLFLNSYNLSHAAPILLSGEGVAFLEHDQPMKGHTLKKMTLQEGARGANGTGGVKWVAGLEGGMVAWRRTTNTNLYTA